MNTAFEILIDNSNSMGNGEGYLENFEKYLLPDGTTRMELVKKILIQDVLPTIDYSSKISVRTFHSSENNSTLIEPIIYESGKGQDLAKQIENLPIPYKTGGTPITGALLNSIGRLKILENVDRKIILITDGEETGDRDYRTVVDNAFKKSGINCNIYIVGISLTKEAQVKARSLGNKTNGGYFHIENIDYERENIQKKLNPLKKTIVSDSISKLGKSDIIADEILFKNSDDSHKIEIIQKRLSENTSLLNLISKQISILNSDLTETKIKENFDNDDVSIIENKELNEKIRSTSEKYLNDILKIKYGENLVWKNINGESGESYDFEIIDSITGDLEYLIECKATSGNDKIFYLTKNEWSLFLKNKNKYQIYLISQALNNPIVTKIENLMDWILQEKVVPYSFKNKKQKGERITFTIIE